MIYASRGPARSAVCALRHRRRDPRVRADANHDVAHTRLQWWRGEIDRLVNRSPQRILRRAPLNGKPDRTLVPWKTARFAARPRRNLVRFWRAVNILRACDRSRATATAGNIDIVIGAPRRLADLVDTMTRCQSQEHGASSERISGDTTANQSTTRITHSSDDSSEYKLRLSSNASTLRERLDRAQPTPTRWLAGNNNDSPLKIDGVLALRPSFVRWLLGASRLDHKIVQACTLVTLPAQPYAAWVPFDGSSVSVTFTMV